MPRALEADAYIHQGVWTDWKKGASTGLTVTLSQQNAAILVAALALFVQMVGSQFWTIIRFMIHQFRATTHAKPAPYHQQQVLVRNLPSSFSFLVNNSFVAARWLGKSRKSFPSFLVLSLCALAHLISFTVLGLFSSRIVKVGNQAVIRSPYCIVNHLSDGYDDYRNQTQERIRASQAITEVRASIEYRDACYHTDSLPKAMCNTLPVPSISFNTTLDHPCPYSGNVCHPRATASRFDTGLIDAATVLGLNTQPQGRIYTRKMVTCVPLNDAEYVKTNSTGSDTYGLNLTEAFYGPSFIGKHNRTYGITSAYQNLTSEQSSFSQLYQLAYAYVYLPMSTENASSFRIFDPIAELAPTDSDLNLVFMAFHGYYGSPINDPWFSSHVSINHSAKNNDLTVNETVFVKDTPISTLSCSDQYQFCINHTSQCTYLQSLRQNIEQLSTWNVSESQVWSLSWLVRGFIATSLPEVITQNGGSMALLADDLVYSDVSLPLPDNQWRFEAANWFSISLAHLQRFVVAQASGRFSTDVSWINTTLTQSQRDLCDNVIIRSNEFQSFSLFALIIVLVIGLFIVLLSIFIESLTGYLQQRYRRGLIRKEMWEANALLQLQRLLYEALGQGRWSDRGHSVPTTAVDDLLKPVLVEDDRDGQGEKSKPSDSTSPYVLPAFTHIGKTDADAETFLMSQTDFTDSDTLSFHPEQIPPTHNARRKPLSSQSQVMSTSDQGYRQPSP